MSDDPKPFNRYEQKQQERRERYEDRAAKARQESASSYQSARSILDVIPMGQPILVGHHSEKRHRRDLDRVDRSMRKSIDASEKAAHYASKAASVGTGGVSQDDPEAVVKLRAEITAQQAYDAEAKAANAALRKAAKVKAKDLGRELRQGDHFELLGALLAGKVISDVIAKALLSQARAFPWLPKLGTNAASIRRIEKRIEEILAKEAMPEREPLRGEVDGVSYTVEWNKADNRVQIYFPFRPSDAIVERLQSRGFRWARSVSAWQRHASEGAWYQACWIVGHVEPTTVETTVETTPEQAWIDRASAASAEGE